MTRLLLAVLLLALDACASLPIAPRGPLETEAAYTALYPYYLEFCALSEIEKKPGDGFEIRGGIGGHSTLFLNGACLGAPGAYPELHVCAPTDGTGLSVNEHFSNANWVGIPGRDFFYHGDLPPEGHLTRVAYEETKAHARRLGIYDSIRFHDAAFAAMPAGGDREAFRYEESIGTDYALGYARDRYCARVPVSRSQMGRIAAYLNEVNRPYRAGSATYVWSVLTDNCIHLAHNALAAIGFWPEWPTHRFWLFAAFDFPVPKNEFVNILRRANDDRLADPGAAWDDLAARRALLAGDGLPLRPGALAVLQPAVRDNDVYDTDALRLIFYDERLFGPYEPWYRAIVADPRYSDLAANRAHFLDLSAAAEGMAPSGHPAFDARFHDAAAAGFVPR